MYSVMRRASLYSIFITIIGIGVTILIVSFFSKTDKTIPNYATVIGTTCSLVGLSIAYVNIIALRNNAEETKAQIEKTLVKINQINSLIDVSKAIKINQEIQSFIHDKKYELALIRIKELKHILIQLSNNDKLLPLTKESDYNKHYLAFIIDVKALNQFLLDGQKSKINFLTLVDNLEDLSTFLVKFENKIKKIDNDT